MGQELALSGTPAREGYGKLRQPRPLSAPVAGHKIAGARRTLWERGRVQLGIGLLLSVLVPWALRALMDFDPLVGNGLQASLGGAALAVVAGYYGFRRVSRYPGVKASFHILPAFTIAYAAVLLAFFFARLDYSRFLLLSSYATCIAWYYVVYFKLQRQRVLTIGIVPFGKVDRLYQVEGINWVTLSDQQPFKGRLDAVVADLRADIPEHWERFLADQALQGTLVMHKKQILESLTGRVSVEHLSENNFGSLVPAVIYGKVKRLIDLAAAIVLLPVLAPLLAFVAALIRLESAGPVLFRQQRMGYRGKVFTIYKFRSMTDADADPVSRSAAVTRTDDDRITRVGRFIRRYRIDELPQVINILKGEMGWIGPRPEAVPLSAWYEAELPFYRYRHIVRPGITGWAQVKQGHVAGIEEVQSKLHYDFYYIKNFSFWLDVLILAGTVRIVAGGFGAK